MIDLNKSVKLTITVDPFTYLVLQKTGKPEEVVQDIITNYPPIYNLAEAMFRNWIDKHEGVDK